MERNFICYTCHHKPVEFTILSCDHIICSSCLEHRSLKKNDICSVQCRCGAKTTTTEESMLLSLKTPDIIQAKQELEKIKSFEQQNTRVSHFFTSQSNITSKESKQNTFVNNHQKNDQENINSLNLFYNQKYTFNPCGIQYSKCFLKTEPLVLDDSAPFVEDDKQFDLEKDKIVKGVKSVQSVHSASPSHKASVKVSSKVSPKKSRARQTPKNKIESSILSSKGMYSTDPLNSIAKQLLKQLKFLQIRYKKQLETCEKAFNKIKKSINLTYQKLVGSLEKFYLSQIVEIEPKEKDEIFLNMPKVVKKKYEATVGRKMIQLGENLLEYFNDPEFAKCTQRQVLRREAGFARKSAQIIEDYKPVKSVGKKSSSKGKQCALYLAISPKKKNDQVVNYIQVIKKEGLRKVCKKVQLCKKGIKGDKIRIY